MQYSTLQWSCASTGCAQLGKSLPCTLFSEASWWWFCTMMWLRMASDVLALLSIGRAL